MLSNGHLIAGPVTIEDLVPCPSVLTSGDAGGMNAMRPRRSGPRPTAMLALLPLLFALAACGGDDTATEETTSTSVAPSTTAGGTSSTTGQATSSTAATSTSTGVTTTGGTTTLPGEPIDSILQAGDVVGVVGVAHDDQLNVRQAPGTDQTILAGAGPTEDDLVATGLARKLPQSIWYELTLDGVTGWANSSYVAYIGATDDATAAYLAEVDRPSAATMEELGLIVADWFASEDPESDIVQSVAPSVGDLGEVTIDVVGIGDDSILGYRLHIFAEPSAAGDSFSLRTIERTWLCWRGLAGELCV